MKLCENARVLPSGGMAIHGLLVNAVTFARYPAPFPPYFLALEVEYEKEDADAKVLIEIRFCDADGRALLVIQNERFLPHVENIVFKRFGEVFPIPTDLYVPGPGEYAFDVLVNNERCGYEPIFFTETPVP